MRWRFVDLKRGLLGDGRGIVLWRHRVEVIVDEADRLRHVIVVRSYCWLTAFLLGGEACFDILVQL